MAKHLPTVEDLDSVTIVVHEIYASVQGESSFAGIPCAFVRLSGCNLRCAWCDTPQAFVGGTRRSVKGVLDEALALQTPLIELTGGEPLLQPGAIPFLKASCDAGRKVLLETSGERDISQVDPRVHRIVDFKAPASGESHRNRWENVGLLGNGDEVKFVLADRADYDWACAKVAEHRLDERAGHVLFSCAFGLLEPKQLSEWIVADKIPVRMQLQMHKYIWEADATGV